MKKKKGRSMINWNKLMIFLGFVLWLYAAVKLPGAASHTGTAYEPIAWFHPLLGVFLVGMLLFLIGIIGSAISFFKRLLSKKGQ